MKYSYSSDGVPILSATNVESEAEQFIKQFGVGLLIYPQPAPLEKISNWLSTDLGIQMDLSANLNIGNVRKKILGLIKFDPISISIDDSLELWQPEFNFTLAHEIGHLVLHSNLQLKSPLKPNPFADGFKDLLTGRKRLVTPLDWIEWQANLFASAMLMPRKSFIKGLDLAQQKVGLSSGRRGRVYVENNFHSLHDFNNTLSLMATQFCTTKTAVEYRLSVLDLLEDKRTSTVQHISEFYRTKAS